jgi:putative ABC transport system ATP-binding protein
VLRDVNLDLAEGDYASLVGPSGSGKTTLLSLIGGLDRPQTGALVVGGQDLTRLSGDDLASFRCQTVGFVFQHFGLLEALTATENVELAMTLAGVRNARQRRRRAAQLLERVGLHRRSDHLPGQLSGGERQRVAIARAVANEPRLILADEPTGDLDDDSAAQVGDLLEQLRAEDRCTLLVVTHQHRLAERADRRLYLHDSGVVESRRGHEIGGLTPARGETRS